MLSLNLKKSGFLIINPKDADRKYHLVLNSDILKYKRTLKYLGVFIPDSGSINQDVMSFIAQTRSNVSIKFTNFCKVNRNAHLFGMLKVLDSYLFASITYACEILGNKSSVAELCYRSDIKVALDVRQTLSNEIYLISSLVSFL